MKSLIFAAAASVLLLGCAAVGPGDPVHEFCPLTDYILIGEADQLTEETAGSILLHNELRARLCD